MNLSRGKTYTELAFVVVREIFQAAFIVYFGLLVVDKLSSGFIADALSLDVFFWIVLGTGMLTAVVSKGSVAVSSPKSAASLLVGGVFGVVAGAIVYSQLGELGIWRALLAVITAVLVFALSHLLHQPDSND